jgi:hypothetical protein
LFIQTDPKYFFGEQNQRLLVDVSLVDSFFNDFQIIAKIVKTKKYPVYYYEELDLSLALVKKSNNQYEKLIINIDDVMARINAKKTQLSL